MMRNLSVGAMLYVLLIVGVLFWGPLSRTAVAQSGLTIGFVFDGAGLVTSSEQGEEIGRYLERQLSIPVKVRSFPAEDQLYSWLTRFREVDVAWLNNDFLARVPSGQLYPLVRNLDHSPGLLRGNIVARPGMNAVLRQQMRVAFLRMNEDSFGRILLAHFGISRFVSPEGEKGPDLESLARLQAEPVPQKSTKILTPVKEKMSAPEDTPVVVKPPVNQENTLVTAQEAGKAKRVLHPDVVKERRVTPAAVKEKMSAPVPEEIPVVVNPPVEHKKAFASSQEAGTAKRVLHPNVVKERKVDSGAPLLSGIDQEAPIALVADSLTYNPEDDSYEAEGDVVLRQAGVELKSDKLLWQAATQDAAAQGSVRLNDAYTEVYGEQLQYNMSTGQGQISDGKVFVHKDNFHLTGEQIEKQGSSDYFVKNGSFTTCDGEIPDWKFSASEVDVTLGGYARAKNVWFHVKDVPVFYTPYLSFPVKTERESGFLMPLFGYSNNKGVRTSLAWYQVIDRNMDATVYLDYLSEIGLGKGLEYRYALANENNGKALYYHVTGFNETPDLYYLEWEHRGKLPGNWRLAADIEYTNKQLFFAEFGELAEDYNRNNTVSTLMLSRNWQKLNLVGHARFIKDLDADNDGTLQRLPELGLGLARYRLGDTPFYASLESYATSFWRRDGEDGERLYVKPTLSAVFKPGSWLEIVPEVAFHERLYNSGAEDDEQFIPEFSLTLATRLQKNFDLNRWGIDRIQHSIEPKVVYTYIPGEDQDDLPLFDLYDRIERRNDITYALINRLTSRSTAVDGSRVYREFFNLRLSQSYDIDEARHNRSGENQPFSALRLELDFSPTRNVSLDVDTLIPVYGDNQSRTMSAGASIQDDKGNAVKINYSYKDEKFAGIATDYVKFQLDTPLLKPVYARFEERYDFRQNRELEKVLGLEYRSKCWSLLLTYRNRYREMGEDDHEFLLTFVLSGLGQNQGFGNGFGTVQE